ncbi:MAG: hypothetical protein H6752_11045 [Candidatus Omnitrophica bacterium]|nr:hypothetical protein [Candidatus Omnitrophota bacterium]
MALRLNSFPFPMAPLLALHLLCWFRVSAGNAENIDPEAQSNVPDIEVSSSILDFGNRPIESLSPVVLNLTIKNAGTANLRFVMDEIRIGLEDESDFSAPRNETDFGDSSGDSAFSIKRLIWRFRDESKSHFLPPYEEQEVSVAFEPKDTHRYEDVLQITTNDPDEPETLVRLVGGGFHLGEATPIPTPPPSLTFPVYYNPNNGHWYGLDFERRTWEEAQDYAVQVTHEGYRGYLATFTSEEELEWVMTNVPFWGRQGAWIGGYQDSPGTDSQEGWRWVTEETWSYSNWNEGEPNEILESEDSLMLWLFAGGTWNDNNGFRETVSIVEFGPPVPTATPTSTSTPTRTPTATFTPSKTQIPPFVPQHCDSGFYVLDSFGGRHRVGNPPVITGDLFFGRDLARDLERADTQRLGSSHAKSYEQAVLDSLGSVHFVKHPSRAPLQDFHFDENPDFPKGRAVDLVMTADGQGFWVLTDFAGIYRAGSALPHPASSSLVKSTVTGLIGFDVPFGSLRDPNLPNPGGASIRAVAMIVIDVEKDNQADGYVILDSQGGHFHLAPDGHEFTAGEFLNYPPNHPYHLLDPGAYPWPFFYGMDIARDLELFPTQEGAVILDGFDGIHPVPWNVEGNPVFFATNRLSVQDPSYVQLFGLPYVTYGVDDPTTPEIDEGDPRVVGIDAASIFTDLEFSAGCGYGLYTMDKYGGVFALGTARKEESEVSFNTPGAPYFFPFLLAEDLEFYAFDESSFETDFSDCESCFDGFQLY